MRVIGLIERIIRTAVVLICLPSYAFAAHLHFEKEYQNSWCADHNGITEYVLDDKTRVDCLTDEYAIEVDFAYKWAEAIGQSLYYAEKTGKKPGIVLILEKPEDKKYLGRLQTLSEKHQIKVWTITPEDFKKRQ